jgi:hypothetical protein
VLRWQGHGTPVVTLTTYAHLFEKTDSAAAKAVEGGAGNGRGTVILDLGTNLGVSGHTSTC